MAQLGDNALNADSEIVLANGKKIKFSRTFSVYIVQS